MILIRKTNLLNTNGEFVPNMDVLIDGKIISQVGTDLHCPGAQVIDGEKYYCTPGFIDAHCHVGIFENGMGFEGDDANEMTNPSTPQLRAIDGINPLDVSFSEALAAGVTAVVTGPGSANVIGGQFVALKTYGKTIDQMVIQEPVALKAALGENPKRVYHAQKQTPMTRMATAAILRQALYNAQVYSRKKKVAMMGDSKDVPEINLGNEILEKVLNRELPLKIHAHRADDIQTAMRIAAEFDIEYTLDHCTEGYLMLDILKEAKVPVILGPVMISRPKVELKNLNYGAAAEFEKAGVEFAISTDHPEVPIQLLSCSAAYCVREGLSEQAALRAITINPARFCGLSDRIGSIEPGKDADIVLFENHPLDVRSRVLYTIIGGEIVYNR